MKTILTLGLILLSSTSSFAGTRTNGVDALRSANSHCGWKTSDGQPYGIHSMSAQNTIMGLKCGGAK